MLLAGHAHHASSQDAGELVTRAGGVLVVQAGTATSTRVREQEQSFNTIDIAKGGVTITVHAWTGDDFTAEGCPALEGRNGRMAHGAGSKRTELGRRRSPRRGAMALPDDFNLDEFVNRVLAEDLGTGGDVTSNATIADAARFTAEMNARQAIVVAGMEIAAAFFRALNSDLKIECLVSDGDSIEHGAVLMRISGNARAMLTAERSALNTLQHLSGIATMTRQYVDAIDGHGRDIARYAQDNPRPAHPREICVADGRGAKPPYAA